MLDTMIGDVAQAIQNDRRAQAAKMARIVEAEQAHLPHAESARRRARRAAIAKALMALAMRLAPPASEERARPEMATRTMR